MFHQTQILSNENFQNFMKMGLPEIISIDRIDHLPKANIVVPGSKSITNRALIAAALSPRNILLEGALWSEDTQIMIACLRALGFSIEVQKKDQESNRAIHIRGKGGFVPSGGSRDSPLELFVGNSGTAARFLMAMLCLGQGHYRLIGTERMHNRPQIGLIDALKNLGYELESSEGRLPIRICGGGKRRAKSAVDLSESSQFASALLLSATAGKWEIAISKSNPYVDMTMKLIGKFRGDLSRFAIEPDASSGTYFWGVNALMEPISPSDSESVIVKNWPQTGWQIDQDFPKYLRSNAPISRENDLGDGIMTAIVLATKGAVARRFLDLGRLRLQECERVKALRTELVRCGIEVHELGDSLIVKPGNLQSATIQTYEDHRIAMCFSMLALSCGLLKISNPSCVKKTFPNFFAKLSAPPPSGLGATIRDAKTGEALCEKNLIAE